MILGIFGCLCHMRCYIVHLYCHVCNVKRGLLHFDIAEQSIVTKLRSSKMLFNLLENVSAKRTALMVILEYPSTSGENRWGSEGVQNKAIRGYKGGSLACDVD